MFEKIGHNDVCNHTCERTFLRDLGVDKWTDVSAEVGGVVVIDIAAPLSTLSTLSTFSHCRTFLRDLGVDKRTDVSAEVGDTITSARSTEIGQRRWLSV